MRKSSRGNPYHDERGRFCSAARATGAFVGDRDIDLNGLSVEEKKEIVKSAEAAEYYQKQTKYREFTNNKRKQRPFWVGAIDVDTRLVRNDESFFSKKVDRIPYHDNPKL